MAYLARVLKPDLRVLAEELGVGVTDDMKVIDLCDAISTHPRYDEERTKNVLAAITENRKLQDQRVAEEDKRKQEEDKRKHEMQLQQLRLESERLKESSRDTTEAKVNIYELTKVLPRFEMKDADIVLFLTLFERQAKRINLEKNKWVSALVALMPSEITQLIARETEEKFDDYDHIKNVLLKRFKLSSESFRQKFIKHQRNPNQSWRDFVFELSSYFEEWIEGLGVRDFDNLKKLWIADQLKRRIPGDVREHFANDWTKLIVPGDLADKLDEYESVRADMRGVHLKYPKNGSAYTYKYDWRKGDVNIKSEEETYLGRNKLSSLPNVGSSRPFKPTCFACGTSGHLARACPNNAGGALPRNAKGNTVNAMKAEPESSGYVVTAKVSIPVSNPIVSREGIDDLQFVDLKCGETSIKAVIDTGAQISVIREDLIGKNSGESEGTIQIVSAFGERETVALKFFNLKVDDGRHGSVPIMCAVSRKLVSDMLICATAYGILLESIQLSGVELEKIPCSTDDIDVSQEKIEESASLTMAQEVEMSGESVKSSFLELQRNDESLQQIWEQARNRQNGYEIDNGALRHTESICGETVKQVVLPTCKRLDVMKVAHEIPLAGHLEDLQKSLEEAHVMASENAERNQGECARRYNLRAREKKFEVGEKVLILDSLSSHRLLRKWIGPASIIAITRPHSVLVKMENGSTKEIHVNKIRPYLARVEQIGLAFDQDYEIGDLHYAPTDSAQLNKNDVYEQVMNISTDLENSQKREMTNLLTRFLNVFSSKPGLAKVKGHAVNLTPGFVPKKQRPYRIPAAPPPPP